MEANSNCKKAASVFSSRSNWGIVERKATLSTAQSYALGKRISVLDTVIEHLTNVACGKEEVYDYDLLSTVGTISSLNELRNFLSHLAIMDNEDLLDMFDSNKEGEGNGE